jgi:hypothetical protein
MLGRENSELLDCNFAAEYLFDGERVPSSW